MSTRREQIVRRITELEALLATVTEQSNVEIEVLKDELTRTPGDLLDRDPDGDMNARIEDKNAFLRKRGRL